MRYRAKGVTWSMNLLNDGTEDDENNRDSDDHKDEDE